MARTHIQHPHFAHPVPVKKNYGVMDAEKAALAAGGVGLLVGIIAVPTFVVGPWIVKAFKPEWSYGRRLAASFAFSAVAGALTRIASAASGADKKAEEQAPKASSTFVPSSASASPR
jgi:hypothetical protein